MTNAITSLDIAACPLCGHSNPRPECLRGGHSLVRCLHCDLVHAASLNIPDGMYDRAHSGESQQYRVYTEGEVLIRENRHHVAWAWRQFFRRVPATPGTIILDVGCATGGFLSHARARGWNIVGTEIGAPAAKIARNLLCCTIYEQPIESLSLTALDAVVAWEVLEHVPDPVGFCRAAHHMLKPGGVFAISTPNWDSPWERKAPDPERHPPFHLTYWTPTSLRQLFEKVGFVRTATARKPIPWSEEIRGRWSELPLAIARSVLLGAAPNRLFAIGYK